MSCSTFRSVTVAAVQMVSSPDVRRNLATAERLVREAAERGAELVLLPEYFPLIGASDADRLAAAENFGSGTIQDFLARLAAENRIWLAGGTIPLTSAQPGKVRNSLLVYDPQGHHVARYDKIHLFGFDSGTERYCEADHIEAGDTPVTFDTPFGRVAVGVCYDLRFPELFRQLDAVDILLLPAAFTATTGRAHWDVLLRARAIENQCFVLASGQGGVHENGRETHGHSMVVDPWGQVLDCLPTGEGVVLAELKASQLNRVRETLPALKHRVFK
ncbi:nitrilase [Formivibrio citricus]|uniref:Nitrilase n=2 Tax=Formivibrio citricus TaxID=83765 RepID=A0A1I4UYK9_9NEIS|nr:nitrilase [Formivibrio citricus]